MNIIVKKLELSEVLLIESPVFDDDRGRFLTMFQKSVYESAGAPFEFVQDNFVFSKKGVLRGLHYQTPPFAQGKLVRAVKGRIFDVAVDIRKNSPNFGKWVGAELSDENNLAIYLPEGFAHGFVSLEESLVLYKMAGGEYAPKNERGVIWNDPQINISWPMNPSALSARDLALPLLKDAEVFA